MYSDNLKHLNKLLDMKNIIIISVSFVLIGLLTMSFGYAQCPQGQTPPAEGYSATDYQNEIEQRVNDTETIINTTLDNISLQTGNYVVLNDKNFYTNNTGGYGTKCKWPYIDAYKDIYRNEINDITYIILTPGDYRDYLTFNPRANQDTYTNGRKYLLHYPGAADAPMSVIQAYFDGTPTAAVNQEEDERAIIENFVLDNAEWSWVIRGVTIRGNHNSRLDDENDIWASGSSRSVITGDNNIVESCLFENQVVGNYLTIINGDNNIVHNSVIRDQQECMITYLAGNDIIGIMFGATKDNFAINNTALNNKIYNVTDAIHLVYQADDTTNVNWDGTDADDLIGDLPGTFIYGNEMFNERIYIDDCGEEKMNGEGAIDIKQGTGGYGFGTYVPICEKVIIADNEFYGWRRAGADGLGRVLDPGDTDCVTNPAGRGGGSGEAVTCHINAKNIVIYNNFVSDCAAGFFAGGGLTTDGYGNDLEVSYIEILDNLICDLYPSRQIYENTPYLQDKQLGLGIKINAPNSKVVGNKIVNTIQGIRRPEVNWINATVEISNNYFENIAQQFFNRCGDYSNFTNNFIADTEYQLSCGGGDCQVLTDELLEGNNCLYNSPICQ